MRLMSCSHGYNFSFLSCLFVSLSLSRIYVVCLSGVHVPSCSTIPFMSKATQRAGRCIALIDSTSIIITLFHNQHMSLTETVLFEH